MYHATITINITVIYVLLAYLYVINITVPVSMLHLHVTVVIMCCCCYFSPCQHQLHSHLMSRHHFRWAWLLHPLTHMNSNLATRH